MEDEVICLQIGFSKHTYSNPKAFLSYASALTFIQSFYPKFKRINHSNEWRDVNNPHWWIRLTEFHIWPSGK